MYQALYRKYRPRSFSDVTEQEHITQTLRSQVMTDRLSHAYLFVGTRGTGKTTCAKILSRAANCMSPKDGDPCNECASCIGIENGTILDVVELDAASNNGVDDIRELRDEAIYTPAVAKKRVYILDEAHMLSTAAVNALLKILEEPPGHVIFILATTELHKVPATIQSRCQKFSFRRLNTERIIKRLQQIAASEGLSLTGDAAEKLAVMADGSMRDGISLLDQCITAADKTIDSAHVQDVIGLVSNKELLELIRAIITQDIITALEILDGLYKDGKDMTALLNELSGILRDLMVVRLSPNSGLLSSGMTSSELSSVSKSVEADRLIYLLDVVRDAMQNLSRTGISKLILEMCIIKMSSNPGHEAPARPPHRPIPVAARTGDAPADSTPEPEDKIESGIDTGDAAVREVAETNDMTASVNTVSDSTAAARADGILQQVLANIDDISLKVLFGEQDYAEIIDDVLVIYMTESGNADTIEMIFLDALKQAAFKANGKEMPIRLEVIEGTGDEKSDSDSDSDSKTNKQKKLESLFAHGDIVKIQ